MISLFPLIIKNKSKKNKNYKNLENKKHEFEAKLKKKM